MLEPQEDKKMNRRTCGPSYVARFMGVPCGHSIHQRWWLTKCFKREPTAITLICMKYGRRHSELIKLRATAAQTVHKWNLINVYHSKNPMIGIKKFHEGLLMPIRVTSRNSALLQMCENLTLMYRNWYNSWINVYRWYKSTGIKHICIRNTYVIYPSKSLI